MKSINAYTVTLWILGFIVVIIMTEQFYNYNENWNEIRRRGLNPELISGDGIANKVSGNHYSLEFYEKHGIKDRYWNPYIFGGMPNVFSGRQHVFVGFIFAVSGTALSFLWRWCYIFELIPLLIVLWVEVLKPPVTPKEIAIAREDQKAFKSMFLCIAGWLLFYWFYAEIK